MSSLQADLLRDLLDDLSDSEPAPPDNACPGQTSGAAEDASARAESTAEPQDDRGSPADGAAASEPAGVAPEADARPTDSEAMGVRVRVLSLPDDVLLSVLRRCARADWLSLACSCRALRAAAAQDGLWLSQPELQQPGSSAESASQQPAGPSVITLDSPHGRAASAVEGAAPRTAAGGTAAPGVPPRKRKRVTADATDDVLSQGPTSGPSRPAGARGSAAAVAATEEEEEQEPGVGSGGTYLGMFGPGGGGTEGCETATVGRCLQDPCAADGHAPRAAQPNGTRLYYQRGAARGQQRSLEAALRRGFLATAWLGNLGGTSVRAEPDQAALPLSYVTGAGGSQCLRYAPGAGACADAFV